MIIPTLVATIIGGATYYVSGKVGKKMFKPESFEEKIEKKLINKAFHVSRTSPFLESHFVQVGNDKLPYYDTVYNLMKWMNFRLRRAVYIDKTVSWYVVECNWESKMEHHYDPEWMEGIIMLKYTCRLPMENYTADEVKSKDFHQLLETQAMIDLWNLNRNKYPHILLHPARMGKNVHEHGLLRTTSRDAQESIAENRPS